MMDNQYTLPQPRQPHDTSSPGPSPMYPGGLSGTRTMFVHGPQTPYVPFPSSMTKAEAPQGDVPAMMANQYTLPQRRQPHVTSSPGPSPMYPGGLSGTRTMFVHGPQTPYVPFPSSMTKAEAPQGDVPYPPSTIRQHFIPQQPSAHQPYDLFESFYQPILTNAQPHPKETTGIRQPTHTKEMAAASSSSATCPLEDSLSCGVCFEKYNSSDHLPKILPCQHTFCKSCVQKLAAKPADEFKDTCTFPCPVCCSEVDTKTEVPTNLAVRDIVEAVASKERGKLFCDDHPGVECILFCTDCCQPVCNQCVKELAKGVHKDHFQTCIDNIDEGKVAMKARLSVKLQEKIASIDKTISGLDQLVTKRNDYAKELDTVIATFDKTLKSWKDDQLVNWQRTIDKQRLQCLSQKKEWEGKLNESDFHEMLKLDKAVKEGVASCDSNTDIRLHTESIDQLKDKLISACDRVKGKIEHDDL